MEKRVNIQQAEPAAYTALYALEKYIGTTKVAATHKHLIKIRASQINGCAFCINMHTADARKDGETEKRIYLLNAWKEVKDLYTEEERAILALTEEVTLISHGGVSDETYKNAAKLFDEQHISQIIMSIVAINAWNRIAIPTQLQPA
jgi:AhpD family alkylhydroperoxidase